MTDWEDIEKDIEKRVRQRTSRSLAAHKMNLELIGNHPYPDNIKGVAVEGAAKYKNYLISSISDRIEEIEKEIEG